MLPFRYERKCPYCKNSVVVRESNVNDCILYDNLLYHRECFFDVTNKRATSRRSNKWANILENIEKVESESARLLDEKAKKYYSRALTKETINDRDRLNEFLCEAYNVPGVADRTFWTKLAKLNNGTYPSYKGEEITYAILLDMWKRKISELDKISENNILKGKEIADPILRIKYDLAILLNKYPSYKKWMNKKKVEEVDSTISSVDNLTSTVTDKIAINDSIKQNSKDDILNLVDDIFG